MTERSILALIQYAEDTFIDNVSGEISALDLRQFCVDLLDTLTPANGNIALVSQLLALTGTPVVIAPFASITDETAGFYDITLATGKIVRLSGANPIIVDFISVGGSVTGTPNAEVTIGLYKNGVAQPVQQVTTILSPTNVSNFAFSGFALTPGSVDAEYEIRASANSNGNYTFTDMYFQCRRQPARDPL